jgi:hypothetical protein
MGTFLSALMHRALFRPLALDHRLDFKGEMNMLPMDGDG